MHLYTYVSFTVVVITTIALYIIFRKNNLKDYRYHLGLGTSAIIAVIASLFLPKMISVISVDWALQFILAFFISFLIYITLLFLVMILFATIFSKEKMDKLAEKWETRKITRQNAKEQKQKQIEQKEQSEHKAEDNGEHSQEPVLKNIFMNRFSSKKTNEARESELASFSQQEQNSKEKEQVSVENTQQEKPFTQDKETAPEQKNSGGLFMEEQENLAEEFIVQVETLGNKPVVSDDGKEAVEPVPIAEELLSVDTGEDGDFREDVLSKPVHDEKWDLDEKTDEAEKEYFEKTDFFDKTADFSDVFSEKAELIEKNVDTPDIIDKMGLETISDTVISPSEQLSLNEMLDRAFLLKQEGNELEAVSLYMNALDLKPDTEVAFWIVLDICVIYKNSGQTELAEEILQTYLYEYKDLMSAEVKEQILQSLKS